jgi:hypothetical protein
MALRAEDVADMLFITAAIMGAGILPFRADARVLTSSG